MNDEVHRHPLNVPDRYYVDSDTCLHHECCVEIAPNKDPISYYEAGQTRIACPTFFAAGFSRGARDADRGGGRAHPHDDHDDQISDPDCHAGYHAYRS